MSSNEGQNGEVKKQGSCSSGFFGKMFGGGEKKSEMCPGGCGEEKCNCNCDLKNHLKNCCGYGQLPELHACPPRPKASSSGSSTCTCGGGAQTATTPSQCAPSAASQCAPSAASQCVPPPPIQCQTVPAFNPASSCGPRKDSYCGKCPPMPYTDTTGCFPNWICSPSDIKYPRYPTPPGVVIIPISMGGRNGSNQVGTSTSSETNLPVPILPIATVAIGRPRARSCAPNIQAIGDIPIQLLPLNYLIPPIPHCHDQPDCYINQGRQDQRRETHKLGNFQIHGRNDSEQPNPNSNLDSSAATEDSAPVKPVKVIENYCEAVESLCSTVEGLLLKISHQQVSKPKDNVNSSQDQSATATAPALAPVPLLHPLILALNEIDQKIQKRRSRSKISLVSEKNLKDIKSESEAQNGNENIIKTTRSRKSGRRSRPTPPPRQRTAVASSIISENCHTNSEKLEVPKRCYSARQSKHLIEIPTPENPFLSMTWFPSVSENTTNSQVKRASAPRSRSLSSRPKSVTFRVLSTRSLAVATQTSNIFKPGDYVSSSSSSQSLGGCGAGKASGTPNVANKDCPMIRPRCGVAKNEKTEEVSSGGFFSKITSFFGGGEKK